MEGACSPEKSFVKNFEIPIKKDANGLNAFIKNLRDFANKSETVLLRSFAKLLGIISLKRKTIPVAINVLAIETPEERTPFSSAKSLTVISVAIEPAAM